MAETIAGVAALAILAVCVTAMMRSQETQNEKCYMDKLGVGAAEYQHLPRRVAEQVHGL